MLISQPYKLGFPHHHHCKSQFISTCHFSMACGFYAWVILNKTWIPLNTTCWAEHACVCLCSSSVLSCVFRPLGQLLILQPQPLWKANLDLSRYVVFPAFVLPRLPESIKTAYHSVQVPSRLSSAFPSCSSTCVLCTIAKLVKLSYQAVLFHASVAFTHVSSFI